MVNSIYLDIVELLTQNIFNGDLSVSPYGEFWVHGFAIIACTALVAMPFVIIWNFIKRFI